jgi:sec-independent protein translocase protein TatB
LQFLGIGLEEILLILVLLVVVVGPRRLPEMAYYLGRGVKKLQHYARLVRDEFSEEFAYLNEEMEAVRADVQEMRTTVREVQDEMAEVRGEVEEVTSEAAGELGEVKAGVEQAASAGQQSPLAAATPASNGASAQADLNGTTPVKGVAGPAHMSPIAGAEPKPVTFGAESGKKTEEEAEDEAGAKPEKPLVF